MFAFVVDVFSRPISHRSDSRHAGSWHQTLKFKRPHRRKRLWGGFEGQCRLKRAPEDYAKDECLAKARSGWCSPDVASATSPQRQNPHRGAMKDVKAITRTCLRPMTLIDVDGRLALCADGRTRTISPLWEEQRHGRIVAAESIWRGASAGRTGFSRRISEMILSRTEHHRGQSPGLAETMPSGPWPG